MIYQIGKLKTANAELAERWNNPQLGYHKIEDALSKNWVYKWFVHQKGKTCKYLIFKSKIRNIEMWRSFDEGVESSQAEYLFVDSDGLVVSDFLYSDVKPTHAQVMNARGGSIFVQSSSLQGHSEYLDECDFSKNAVVSFIQHEFCGGKTPKLLQSERLLKKLLYQRKRWLLVQNAAVGATYAYSKRMHLEKITNKATRHKVKFAKFDVLEYNKIAFNKDEEKQ